MDDPRSQLDIERLKQLIANRCNGSLDPSECQELEVLLAASPEARSIYLERLSIHAGLCWMYRGKLECDNRLADLESDHTESAELALAHRKRGAMRPWTWWLPMSIASLILIAMWTVGWRDAQRHQSAADLAATQAASKGEILGSLTPLSTDCRWSFGAPGESNRQEFRSLDTMWLNHGAAELRLVNGTVAQLEAPLILEMVSIDRARVLRGRMTVHVAKGAEGFTVDTEMARIIDHGTTFSVDVSDARNTDVVVFQGEVEVNFMQHGAGAGDGRVESSTRLRTGEAARVAEDGTLSRIVNVQRADFSENRTYPSVVKEVRDNIVREQTMKYYEIVHGGMGEDAVAFVDRDYQWNGVDAQGIPSYLQGGDYVKTFNDDKVTQNLIITVTLERPATLYLLVDDRLQQTDWLSDQFEDTGDDVGLDEGPHIPNDVRSLASGPGKSIDQVHSIWRCRVPHGGTISIGPNGPAVPETSSLGTKAGVSMYGIVVVPSAADEAP